MIFNSQPVKKIGANYSNRKVDQGSLDILK